MRLADLDLIEDLPDAAEDQDESDDEDFNPTTIPAEESSDSSEDDDASCHAPARGAKRKALVEDDWDSGDEVTIEAARKRRAKRRRGAKDGSKDILPVSDDEGGEGGLIKTRAQRRVEEKERRPLARTEGATVNVKALWTELSAAPLKAVRPVEEPTARPEAKDVTTGASTRDIIEQEDEITVTKIYTFAGQRTTEEKQIPRSALAKHLLVGWKTSDKIGEPSSEVADTQESDPTSEPPKICRPLRRPSRFDPNPIGYVKALPPEAQLTWPRKILTHIAVDQENVNAFGPPTRLAKPEKAQKLNVVDKSRMDWTGFVVKEGIAEELDTHGKTKEAYLGRMNFLAGVEARKEEDRRRAKTAAAASQG